MSKPSDPSKTPQTWTSWKALDSDLNRVAHAEYAAQHMSRLFLTPGLGFVFIALAALWAAIVVGAAPGGLIIVIASAFAAYLALNIGANDVANNMGPAVGARALSLTAALVIAAIFEIAGAVIGGGPVVDTIANDIVSAGSFSSDAVFVTAMLAALLAAALWINLATWIGAPISTTHSIVGAVVGGCAAGAGVDAVNWPLIVQIASTWVLSPVLGGAFAAFTLWLINALIISKTDKIGAARTWVPVLIGLMVGVFGAYIASQGLSKIVKISWGISLSIGLALGFLSYVISYPYVQLRSVRMENRNKSVKVMMHFPLILAAALLSFAHGANDVSNAVGPLAAIVRTIGQGGTNGVAAAPMWVMLIGALGISAGLLLFGRKMINMVGVQITKLNAIRAYCVALATAVTVITASWVGFPVSSTHIAIGGIFGVGFLRESIEAGRMSANGIAKQSIAVEERRRRRLVRRSHFMTIIAAWVITVPATAVLSAMMFWALRGLNV